MKKIFFLLLALVLAFHFSITALASQNQSPNEEITFGGISFGTKYKDAYAALSSFKGKVSKKPMFDYLASQPLFTPIAAKNDQAISKENGFPYLKSVGNFGYQVSNTENFQNDFFVAGYKVDRISLYFSSVSLADGSIINNANSAELYAGEYVIDFSKWEYSSYQTVTPFKDAFSAFDDLKSKLSSKYGTPIEFTGNESFTEGSTLYRSKYAIWLSDNHTGIMLHVVKRAGGYVDLYISYGKTDMYDLIQKINGNEKKTTFGGL